MPNELPSILASHKGSYDEERLYVLTSLTRNEAINQGIAEANAVLRAKLDKQAVDLNEAHNRARELKTEVGRQARHLLRLEMRAGVIATAAGSVVGALFEIAKWLLHR